MAANLISVVYYGYPSEDANLGKTSLPPCSILSPGQNFSGNLVIPTPLGNDRWMTNILIQGVDFERGHLYGTMESTKLADRQIKVKSFWEGDFIEHRNHTFITGKWQATQENDAEYWERLSTSTYLKDQERSDPSLDGSYYPIVYMRLKEQKFLNVGQESGYTIAGFYYLTFSLHYGTILGIYYDPDSPARNIDVSHECGGQNFSSSSYELR